MTGIIGAMESEISLIAEEMSKNGSIETVELPGYIFYKGKIGNTNAVAVVCGIGKVCAASVTQLMIDRFNVSEIINTGVAGGIGEGLEIGDFVVSEDAVQYDFDLCHFGYHKGYVPAYGKNHDKCSAFPADKELVEIIIKSAEDNTGYGKAVKGRILSGDRFVADDAFKKELVSEFSGTAVEMEGAAIAQVCFMNKIPFAIIRAISDLAGKEADISFETFEKEAANRSAHIVIKALKSMRKSEI